LLESVYRNCLAHELRKNGFHVEVEKPISIIYDGEDMGHGFRIDILVEDRLILELKVVDKIIPAHIAQTLSYLRFANKKYALILNFMQSKLKFGIKRVAL
jgi:GxxExxY protein